MSVMQYITIQTNHSFRHGLMFIYCSQNQKICTQNFWYNVQPKLRLQSIFTTGSHGQHNSKYHNFKLYIFQGIYGEKSQIVGKFGPLNLFIHPLKLCHVFLWKLHQTYPFSHCFDQVYTKMYMAVGKKMLNIVDLCHNEENDIIILKQFAVL